MHQLKRYIRSVTPAHAPADVPDRVYLKRFARARDEAAFAALVGRYGGSVWGVCRRLTGGEHDAEDVFQATFLTLARKAASIDGGSLPAWLHGVARRVAANLRRGDRRRADREFVAARRDGAADMTWHDGVAVLDEELARLPERYRAVLIACCLEGRSRDEAAAHLGWSDGQVKGRLERARDLLRRRLERRGVEVGAILLAAAVSRSASGVPPVIASSAIASAPAVSPAAAAMSEGVVREMFLRKIGLVSVMVVAVVGGGLLTYHAAAARTPGAAGLPAQEPERQQKAAGDKVPPAGGGATNAGFDEVSIKIQPGGLARQMPETITVRGDGTCGYRIEERPARGTEPKWDGAYLQHKLPPERLRTLETILGKADWLAKGGKAIPVMHATKYTLSLKRKGETRTVVLDGEPGESFRPLVDFFRGVALQENYVYRLERLPPRERNDAFRDIDQFVRAEAGGPYGKPPYEIDLRRYVPIFQRAVRYADRSSADELAPAVRLLGYLRSEADREYIVALANDRDLNVRTAVAEALGRLGGKESLPVLRRMVRNTEEAAWQLVRLGPPAVPTVVDVIESGTDPSDERNPDFIDYEKMIRAFIDHWKDVPKPVDPRVLAAVRKSMDVPKIKGFRIPYHKELLELASVPPPK